MMFFEILPLLVAIYILATIDNPAKWAVAVMRTPLTTLAFFLALNIPNILYIIYTSYFKS